MYGKQATTSRQTPDDDHPRRHQPLAVVHAGRQERSRHLHVADHLRRDRARTHRHQLAAEEAIKANLHPQSES